MVFIKFISPWCQKYWHELCERYCGEGWKAVVNELKGCFMNIINDFISAHKIDGGCVCYIGFHAILKCPEQYVRQVLDVKWKGISTYNNN